MLSDEAVSKRRKCSRMQQQIGNSFSQYSTQDTYCLHDSVLKLKMAHCDWSQLLRV